MTVRVGQNRFTTASTSEKVTWTSVGWFIELAITIQT